MKTQKRNWKHNEKLKTQWETKNTVRNWKHSEKLKTQWETENTVRNCQNLSEKLQYVVCYKIIDLLLSVVTLVTVVIVVTVVPEHQKVHKNWKHSDKLKTHWETKNTVRN